MEKKRMKRFFYFIPVLLICFFPAAWAGTADPQAPLSFVLLHVNDTHSQFSSRHVTFRFPGVESPVRMPLGSVARMGVL
jgi:5'-nucleotidase / UDP-sugar diphosphatase